MSERWEVISPDGLRIEPRTYRSQNAAVAGLVRWIGRYERIQGFYAAASGERIPVVMLMDRCIVRRVQG